MKQELLFIAGDPSGDMHCAPVITECIRRMPQLQCGGIGGPAMQRSGFTPRYPFEPFNKMGFSEVIRSLPFFLRVKKELTHSLSKNPPAAVVLIDYPGFNIEILKAAAQRDIPVLWYIPPKVWAWKKHRAQILADNASVIATIFPFENQLYNGSARVAFVGNPLMEALQNHPETTTEKQCIALIPGSRKQEIERILPVMVECFRKLKQNHPQLRAEVSRCEWLPTSLFDVCRDTSGLSITPEPLPQLLQRCHTALVTSGTATLETALRAIPHVILYKTSPLTYHIMKRLITIEHIGLPNIVAQRSVVPELIQSEASAENCTHQLSTLLPGGSHRAVVEEDLQQLRAKLGEKRPSVEVAGLIEELVHRGE
jgi:lipid-A-disaccharide synthase